MPVPTTIAALDTNADNNSPPGTESAKGNIDNYLRAAFAFIKQTSNLTAGATATLASASTVAIGAAAVNNITISGTATITAFDTVAEGSLRFVIFSGVLTLTHNATSLILPGAANIVTAANDTAIFKSLGGGNWQCLFYQPTVAWVGSVTPGRLLNVRVFTTSATYTPTAGTNAVVVEVQGAGGAGGGAQVTGAGQVSAGSGGGAGGYARSRLTTGFSGAAVTVGAGGSPSSGFAGGNGGSSSFGALLSATGGPGGTVGVAQSQTVIAPVGGVGGGAGSGGNILNETGGVGNYGFCAAYATSGSGGASAFGGGAPGVSGLSGGNAAGSYGAGGSGGALGPNSGTNAGGGVGGGGVVVIHEYA